MARTPASEWILTSGWPVMRFVWKATVADPCFSFRRASVAVPRISLASLTPSRAALSARTLAPGDSGALGKLRWLQIEPNDSIDDEDEQVAERDESEAAELELREFCGHCGILNLRGSSACSGCKASGLVRSGSGRVAAHQRTARAAGPAA